MQILPHHTFLDGLKVVLEDGISAVALSLEEIFLLANENCAPKHNISYGDYMRFVKTLNEYGEPPQRDAQTDLYLRAYKYIKSQEVRQRRALLQKVQDGQKDWRRFVWLLQMRQREERLKLALAKQQERERKEKQKAAELAAKQEATAQAEQNASLALPAANTLQTSTLHPQPTDEGLMAYKKTG